MVDILQRVGTQSPTPEKVYDALTTVEGLAGWWTVETTGNGAEVGGGLQFRFHGQGGADMEVVELRPLDRVVWRVVSLKALLETGEGAPSPKDVPVSNWG